MRAAKPFKTEYKSRRPPKPSALFDDTDLFTEPSRDINEDLAERHEGSYEAAMRAADAVFGSKEASPAETAPEPTEEPKKRILSDLSYVDPLEARLAVEPPRRGRKPGSTNSPKPSIEAPVSETAAAPPPAAAPPRPTPPIVFRRRAPGFLELMRAKRSMKPGERWKARP